MTLIDTLMPRRRPGRALALRSAPEQSPAIAALILDVERELAALRDELPQTALDALGNFSGAAERVAEIDSKTAVLGSRLGVLRAAHTAAEAADAKTAAQLRATARAVSIAAVHTALAKRDAAATRLSEAIAASIPFYRELIEQSRLAQAACPAGEPWPEGSLTDPEALARLVSIEIYRADGGRQGTAPTYPRGSVPVLPDLMPIPEKIRTASRFCFDQLSRRS